MYKKILDKFFKENGVKDAGITSAPAVAHFQIKLLLSPETNDKLQGVMDEIVFKNKPDRESSVLAEKTEIEAITSPEEIIKFMRRGPDPMNQHILAYKAMEFEDEVIPEVIRRLKTNLTTEFIETAARVLSVCKKDIAGELIGYYNDVRSPYAQTMILIILGFKADETAIPWLIEQYHKMKRLYPNESYQDGAFYALDEIESRLFRE
jgi:hypothetical protein